MTPNVGKPILRPGVDHIVDILFLASGPNVFTVKMIDRIEFQALGAVAGHEVDSSAGGFEDVASVGDGTAKRFSVSSEDTHTLRSISGILIVEALSFCLPMLNC